MISIVLESVILELVQIIRVMMDKIKKILGL